MIYKIVRSKDFKKSFKKLSESDKDKVLGVLYVLANDETLEPKYKDHRLQGRYSQYRSCHVKPDLVLIYRKDDNILTLTAFRIGSHSEVY